MTNRRSRSAVAAGLLGLLLVLLPAAEARGAPGWRWPVSGSVITPYSNDAAHPYAAGMHRGIDIGARVGTAVRAARAGEVTYAGALGYSGLVVAVRTVDGYVTSYLHLSAVGVHRGDTIDAGTRVGAVGTTGRRSKPDPHLHFGVRVASTERRYVDPLGLLPPLPGARPAVPAVPIPARAPAAPQPALVRRPVRLPAPAARRPAAAPDPGYALALAGIGLLLLALFGRVAIAALTRALRCDWSRLRPKSAGSGKTETAIRTREDRCKTPWSSRTPVWTPSFSRTGTHDSWQPGTSTTWTRSSRWWPRT